MEDIILSGSGLNISDDLALQVSNMTNPEEIPMRYFNSALILFFFLIGLPWNVMVIGIILKKKLYSQPSLMLMLSLAITNLFLLLIHTPLSIITAIGHLFIDFGDLAPLCKTSVFITLFPLISTHTIAMMSVDRVIYLKKPLTYHLIVTPWRMFAAIAVMWTLCIALVLPFVSLVHRNVKISSLDACTTLFMDTWVIKFIIAQIAVATLVQFVGCGCIIFITRTHLRKKLRRALNNSIVTNGETRTQIRTRSVVLKDYSKLQMSLVFVFGAIFVTGLLSAVPLVSMYVVSAIFAYDPPSYVFTPTYILYLSRSAINPILEVSLTHEIRSSLCKQCTAMRRTTCCGVESVSQA